MRKIDSLKEKYKQYLPNHHNNSYSRNSRASDDELFSENNITEYNINIKPSATNLKDTKENKL